MEKDRQATTSGIPALRNPRLSSAPAATITWDRTAKVASSGVQLAQHGGTPTVEVAGMYLASNGTGRCATLPGSSSSKGHVSGQW
jgi:hypothetical protein